MSREEAAANAISESSGRRFDGFWSRVEDLEPEDREYALQEATAALAAADAHDLAHGVHRIVLDDGTVERAARGIFAMNLDPITWSWKSNENHRQSCMNMARAVLSAAVQVDK